MCVRCKSHNIKAVVLKEKQGEILNGLVICTQCGATYPIVHGLPCFLLPELRPPTLTEMETKLCASLRDQLNHKKD